MSLLLFEMPFSMLLVRDWLAQLPRRSQLQRLWRLSRSLLQKLVMSRLLPLRWQQTCCSCNVWAEDSGKLCMLLLLTLLLHSSRRRRRLRRSMLRRRWVLPHCNRVKCGLQCALLQGWSGAGVRRWRRHVLAAPRVVGPQRLHCLLGCRLLLLPPLLLRRRRRLWGQQLLPRGGAPPVCCAGGTAPADWGRGVCGAPPAACCRAAKGTAKRGGNAAGSAAGATPIRPAYGTATSSTCYLICIQVLNKLHGPLQRAAC